MRIAAWCMLAALVVVPWETRAELPMDPAALGQLEAVLEHCGQASPASAEHYRALGKSLTGGATEQELTEARASPGYRGAHQAASAQLAGLSREEAEQACLEGSKP